MCRAHGFERRLPGATANAIAAIRNKSDAVRISGEGFDRENIKNPVAASTRLMIGRVIPTTCEERSPLADPDIRLSVDLSKIRNSVPAPSIRSQVLSVTSIPSTCRRTSPVRAPESQGRYPGVYPGYRHATAWRGRHRQAEILLSLPPQQSQRQRCRIHDGQKPAEPHCRPCNHGSSLPDSSYGSNRASGQSSKASPASSRTIRAAFAFSLAATIHV